LAVLPETTVPRPIRLRGVTSPFQGCVWESPVGLRVGRQGGPGVTLDHDSVSRQHAMITPLGAGWAVTDLASTNGTQVNGNPVGASPCPLSAGDLVQFGEVTLVVESVGDRVAASPPWDERLRVQGATRAGWDEALRGVAFDANRAPRPGEQILALLRAGHHLVHLGTEDRLLRSILEDAVAVLNAQRGAIVLADEPDGELLLRSVVSGPGGPPAGHRPEPAARGCYSRSLARRSLSLGESILCQHVSKDELASRAVSVAEGMMTSVVCVLLRTPRRRLGVLHLDRGPGQPPFAMADLHLADALAANVSAGIESAGLLRKQRDLFLNTVNVLAQMVELRDPYTGGHTARVTAYAVLLAQELNVPPADLDLVRMGGPLHDVGKVGVDDAILRKPGPLTDAEFEAMKLHVVRGAEIVAAVPDLHPVLPIVRSHHERWDGTGYPDRLARDQIARVARVVAVADAFDAMTSDRPYRKGLAAEAAFAELEHGSGTHFDPDCVTAFLAIRAGVVEEMRGTPGPAAVITRELRACLTG
jgi:putative nucleotidyltransferase with HDIG domain